MAALKLGPLKALCAALADDLLRTGSASAEAVSAVRPGGEDNPSRDGSAWLRFYGQLQLLRGRAQAPGRSGSGDVANGSDDSLTLAALAAAPMVVRTTAGERTVHPKSLSTLLHCHGRELVLARLAKCVAELADVDVDRAYLESLTAALEEIDYQTRVLAWIATSEGPALPFGPHDRDPAVPDAIAALDPLSVVEINRGFARANWVNLRAMQSLIEPDPEAGDAARTRPSWSVFVGALAIELHEDPADLINNRALVSIMASTQLAASSRRSAMNDAKRRHEQSRNAGEAAA